MPVLNIHQITEWNTLSSRCYGNKFCFAQNQGKKKKQIKRRGGREKNRKKTIKHIPFK